MSLRSNYAYIHEGTVKTISVFDEIMNRSNYELANWLARATYGDSAIAVDCTNYPCSKDDIYRDGKFYRTNEDGTERLIEYIPTQEQQVAQLQRDNDTVTEYQVDMEYRLSCQELGL